MWRAGANVTTRLKSEVPLIFGDKKVPAGEYSLFIDLNGPAQWTLIVSSWPAQLKFDPKDKAALWGAYGYTADKDVARIPMRVETLPFGVEQLTWSFLDMTDAGLYCADGDFLALEENLMAAGYRQIGDAWVYLINAHEWGHGIQ